MKVEWKSCFRVGISVLIVYFCIRYWAEGISLISAIAGSLSSLLMGAVIAYVVNILMSFLEVKYRDVLEFTWIKNWYRPVCMILAYLLLLLLAAAIFALIVPELLHCVQMLMNELPRMLEELMKNPEFQEIQPLFADQINTTMETFSSGGISELIKIGWMGAFGSLTSSVMGILTSMMTYFLALVFSVYFLLDKDRLYFQAKRIGHRYLGEEKYAQLVHVLHVVDRNTRSFIISQCIRAVLLGILTIVLMFLFRFPYALMIGTLMGFTALIPVAGAYIGSIAGFLMVLTVSWKQALLFAVFILILQQFDGNYMYPRIVGGSIGLPAIWVLAAVMAGGGIAGIGGMMIAVPAAASVYQLLMEDLDHNDPAENHNQTKKSAPV